jgi:hypothetical protein
LSNVILEQPVARTRKSKRTVVSRPSRSRRNRKPPVRYQ